MNIMLWGTLAAIIPLLFLSAFLSGTETALTAASRGRLHQMAHDGSRNARIALQLVENPDRLLGAILIGNNLVNILATALATFVLVRVFDEGGVLIATLGMTALIVIFAEITPKTYAISVPESVALRSAGLVRGLVFLLTPILVVVQAVTRGILRLVGSGPGPDEPMLAVQQEIRGTIELGHKRGAFVKRDRDILVAAMDLEATEVSEVMTPRGNVDMLDANANPETLIEFCLESQHTRLPLWQGSRDQIIGVVHTKDLFRAAQAHRQNEDTNGIQDIDIRSIASKPNFVPEHRSLADQLRAFQSGKDRIALAVDEYGDFQGVVTLEDIVEDIVGDITEADDEDAGTIERQADGSYAVDGTVTIRTLNRECDWNLPDEEATTVAGLVIHEAQRIPEKGQAFNFHGFRFEITGRDRNRISSLVIRALEPAAGKGE